MPLPEAERFECSEWLRPGRSQQLVQLTLTIERVHIVAAANGFAADEDLRNGALTRGLNQVRARRGIVADVNFAVFDALIVQQTFRADTIGAHLGRVVEDRVGHSVLNLRLVCAT